MSEHFAHRYTYFSLDPTYKDRFGDPLLRLTMDWTPNERRLRDHISAKALEIARAVPGVQHIRPSPPYGRYDSSTYRGTHLQGGVI